MGLSTSLIFFTKSSWQDCALLYTYSTWTGLEPLFQAWRSWGKHTIMGNDGFHTLLFRLHTSIIPVISSIFRR